MADIEALEARLAESKAQLISLIDEIDAKRDDIDCAANAQLVLSRLLGTQQKPATLAASDVRQLGKIRRRQSGRAR